MNNLTEEEYESLRKIAETCVAHKNFILMQQAEGNPLSADDEGLYLLETGFMFLYKKFVVPNRSKVN